MRPDDERQQRPLDPWYRSELGKPNRISFAGSPRPTLGLELELQIVDPETGALAHGAPRILEHFEDVDWVKPELLQSTVEVNVGPCETVPEARAGLVERLSAVLDVADELGYGLLAAGTHPFSRWEDQRVTEQTRYEEMVERVQWPIRRLTTFGLHVHVGVSSGEKAIAIANSLAGFLPHLLALSASSPFWHGQDTGLASARVKVFETLPSAGLPYRLADWGEFQRLMNTLINAEAIKSIREIWWDVRPHTVFGTVETRIADAMPTLSENLAVAALNHCLVHRLAELYDDGQMLPLRPHWVLAENKWRAARSGTEAMLICDDGGLLDRLDNQIEELVESLEPAADELDCPDDLMAVREMLRVGSSASRQRRVYEGTGALEAVVGSLCAELRDDDVLAEAL